MTQVVVLAGGLATRMRPHTETTPKILLEVAGRPFLHHLVDRLAASGASSVVLLLGHLASAVRAAVPASSLPITLVEDGPRLLGTAGALRGALGALAETFVVTYGDSYLELDLGALERALVDRPEAQGAMAVWKNEGALEPSNVALDEQGFVSRYVKRGGERGLDHIDFGATALRREVIAALPADEPLGFDVVQATLARERALLAFPVQHRFFEIGSPGGLADLERHLRTTRTST
ncbi:MAG: NTP transferase domain-containing protein [Polyangiaceae bacterium]